MYSIVLEDGKTINVNANEVLWSNESRMIKLFNGEIMVARINMENIAGWIDADYKEKSYDVLNKIKAEIEAMSGDIETIADVLAIIDKYKKVRDKE